MEEEENQEVVAAALGVRRVVVGTPILLPPLDIRPVVVAPKASAAVQPTAVADCPKVQARGELGELIKVRV
jgi:hypothetical protein